MACFPKNTIKGPELIGDFQLLSRHSINWATSLLIIHGR